MGLCEKNFEKVSQWVHKRLIQVSKDFIDYVVVHELCHLKEHNHSRKYYDFMDRVMPDWKQRRDQLNGFEFG